MLLPQKGRGAASRFRSTAPPRQDGCGCALCLFPVRGSPIKANPTAPTTKFSTLLHFIPHRTRVYLRCGMLSRRKMEKFTTTRYGNHRGFIVYCWGETG